MSLDDFLETVSLIDCSGHTTHRLTLLIDGTVGVKAGQVEVVVDPSCRTVRPVHDLGRGEYSHEQVIDAACTLARTM